MNLERDNAYFAEDSNFCPDCHEEWARCECSCPEKDNSQFFAVAPLSAFRGVQLPPEAGSCTSGAGIEAGVRITRPVSLRAEWTLFFLCVGLDALVLYALMAAAERWAR